MDWTAILIPTIPVVAGFIISLARTYVMAKVSPARLEAISTMAMAAVSAAEECGRTAPIAGADKFVLASDAISAYAKRLGVNLSSDELQTFVHSALVATRSFNNANK